MAVLATWDPALWDSEMWASPQSYPHSTGQSQSKATSESTHQATQTDVTSQARTTIEPNG